jgi:hypothetical protein
MLATTMALPALMTVVSAAAGPSTLAQLNSELVDWGSVMAENAGGDSWSFEEGLAEPIARSFWYEGLAYEPPYTLAADEGPAAKLARSCKKTYGARGVVRRNVPRFLSCLAISSFENAFGDNGLDWSEAALGKLPPPFRRHRAKLGGLARTHWLVISHFHNTDERVDLWNLYVLERGADLRIAGILVGRKRSGRS